HRCIDGENATLESWQDFFVDPGAEHCTLHRVLACHLKRTQFDFKDGNGREKKTRSWNRSCPRYNIAIGSLRSPEFGDNIGVEQEHHSRSAGLKMPPPKRGGSNSKSASPG